jgi:hypothetical protein
MTDDSNIQRRGPFTSALEATAWWSALITLATVLLFMITLWE